ncbi:MAG: preprotein translocase subunit YajC [Syntrophus sp. PtaB.Bin001]|nr:MAG: preprotein translocase subunit YajC [Syntrophus sp. PtaB.Bin001]
MTDLAYAMGNLGGGGTGGSGDVSFLIMMAVIFGIFYFLLIRPQQKKQKEIKEMLEKLTHGDVVVTSGGIHGKITAITGDVITLEVADKVRIKVSRSFIAAVLEKAGKE